MTTNQHVVPSEWAPLQIAAFRAIWFASLAANVGTWFQNVGGVWLMTRFTTSPLLIALMQTATTLPVFLVGLPAGALADIVNRRRLLLATQGLILVAAAALSVLTFAGLMNVPLLLGFTFVLGLGAILANPAWQAVNTELVPPDELPAAVTLSSVSYNLARAVGSGRPSRRDGRTGGGLPAQRPRLPVCRGSTLSPAPGAPPLSGVGFSSLP